MASLKAKIAKELAERLKAGDELAMDFASRMQRAADQGFDTSKTYYHGTTTDVPAFDVARSGDRGHNFGDAVFSTDSPEVASGYSVGLSNNKEFSHARGLEDLALKKRNSAALNYGVDSSQFKAANMDVLRSSSKRDRAMGDATSYRTVSEGGNILPVNIAGNMLDVDAMGQRWNKVNKDAIDRAKDEGYDGVRIHNVIDSATSETAVPSTVIASFDPKNIRSVNAAFDPAKKESSNLLAGLGAGVVAGGAALAPQDAEASFIGKMAKTFSKPAQEMAEKMAKAGKSRDEIWKATGDEFGMPTYKDIDGHWKQEISDKGAGFSKSGLRDLKDYGWRKQGDIYNNKELFNAYPESSDILTGQLGRADLNSSGMLTDNNEILLNPAQISDAISRKKIAGETLDDIGRTNIHELQHSTQGIEGFAQGGSPQSFVDDYNKNLHNINFLESKRVDDTLAVRKSFSYKVNEEKIRSAIKSNDKDLLGDLLSNRREMEQGATNDTSREIIRLQERNKNNPFEQYQRLAGEAEARNVETRLNMPMNERIDKAPWTTLDVPEDELIVRGNRLNALGGGVGATSLGALTATQDASAQARDLPALLAMRGEQYRPDTIHGARPLGALGSIADLIESADRNIDGPANMIVPTGTAEYIRKLQYGDDIGYLDRLFANPFL